jgi:hypothetical protein
MFACTSPADITADEAEKVARVILAYAVPRDSGSRSESEDPRSGAEAEGRQNGARSAIARSLPA